MTKYQIVRYAAIYCEIYGGMKGGSTAHRLPMAYSNAKLALKLASRMHDADYNNGGDDSYGVIEYGANPYQTRYAVAQQFITKATDDMPF